jgi:hypothetical protein
MRCEAARCGAQEEAGPVGFFTKNFIWNIEKYYWMNISLSGMPILRRPFMALMVAFVCFLLVIGCTSTTTPSSGTVVNPDHGFTPYRGSPNATDFTTLPESSSRSNHILINVIPSPVTEPFISTDAVSDHRVGDIITFRGTTNLPEGERIALFITENSFRHCPKSSRDCSDSVDFCCGGISRNITVRTGDDGLGSFSWDVNTSQHEFSKDSYTFAAYSKSDSRVSNGTLFNLT